MSCRCPIDEEEEGGEIEEPHCGGFGEVERARVESFELRGQMTFWLCSALSLHRLFLAADSGVTTQKNYCMSMRFSNNITIKCLCIELL